MVVRESRRGYAVRVQLPLKVGLNDQTISGRQLLPAIVVDLTGSETKTADKQLSSSWSTFMSEFRMWWFCMANDCVSWIHMCTGYQKKINPMVTWLTDRTG